MTNYELVRNKVIEAVPDVKERIWKFDKLDFVSFKSFGKFIPSKFHYWLIKLTEINAAIRSWEMGTDGKGNEQLRIYENRHIRFSDIIRAVRLSKQIKYNAEKWLVKEWNMNKDSLEWHRDNKPEVVDFLAEILK